MAKPGFSLLEILIVIVIIGLLAVFGHSEYVSYVQRAKVSEALNVLEEYQAASVGLLARNGTIAPYYVLFSDADQTGLTTGSPTSDSASKTVDLKYVDNIIAIRGTTGGNNYILLGAELQNDGVITNGADFVYVAGVIATNGSLSWQCGSSASQNNTIPNKYLPKTCQNTLP